MHMPSKGPAAFSPPPQSPPARAAHGTAAWWPPAARAAAARAGVGVAAAGCAAVEAAAPWPLPCWRRPPAGPAAPLLCLPAAGALAGCCAPCPCWRCSPVLLERLHAVLRHLAPAAACRGGAIPPARRQRHGCCAPGVPWRPQRQPVGSPAGCCLPWRWRSGSTWFHSAASSPSWRASNCTDWSCRSARL